MGRGTKEKRNERKGKEIEGGKGKRGREGKGRKEREREKKGREFDAEV